MCYNLYNKSWFGCFWAGYGHGFRFHKVELMLGEWAAHGHPTAHLGTVKNSPSLLGWTEIGPWVFQTNVNFVNICIVDILACVVWKLHNAFHMHRGNLEI